MKANRQMQTMLVYEGLFYAIGSSVLALILSVILNPFAEKLLETMFWFFHAKNTFEAIFITAPIFALLGGMIPYLISKYNTKYSVVERLRENI